MGGTHPRRMNTVPGGFFRQFAGLNGDGRLDRRDLLPLLAFYAVPLVLGVAYLAESRDNPFFSVHFSDEVLYRNWARDLAAGKGFFPTPYFISPLYLFFYVVLVLLRLDSFMAIRVTQLVLGCFVYPLAYALGRRLFSRRAGFIGAVVLLGYGTLLFVLTDLAPPAIETLLIMVFANLLLSRQNLPLLAAAGVTGGILALSRPTMLLFAAVYPLALLLAARSAGTDNRRAARHAAVFLAAFCLPILPVTLRNYIVGQDFVLISSHGGINFFIGNSPQSPGTMYCPPGLRPTLMGLNHDDASRVAEAESGRALKSSEVSTFWFRKGLSFLREQPGAAARLYARKVFLLLHSNEVSTNTDYYLFKERSLVLKTLAVPYAVLLVAGVCGLCLTVDRWARFMPLYLLLGVPFVTPVVFFAAFRFRVPATPLLAVCAGLAADAVLTMFPRRPRTILAAVAGAACLVALLSYPYPSVRASDLSSRASLTAVLGIQHYIDRDMPAAEAALRKAIRLWPGLAEAHWYLALALEAQAKYPAAMEAYRSTAELYGSGAGHGPEANLRYRGLRQRLQGR